MNIVNLPSEFRGTGEVDDFQFNVVHASDKAYIYQVNVSDSTHYEVFERKKVPLCIDFANRIYSETDFKEVYPKAKDFGIWAWTYNKFSDALVKLNEISNA